MDALPQSLRLCVLEDLILGEEIGRGSHGRVVAATWEGAPVAVKQIHSLFSDVASDFEYDSLRETFLRECVRSIQIRHPNIVRFLGIYLIEGAPIPRLVMERLNCNLDTLLLKHPVIPEEIKYNIVHGVALGIRFLHTRRPSPIIHRDLSSKNVLVSNAMEGKIGDLGTARFVDERRKSQMTRAPGTADFMPPEVLTDHPTYSISVDLFSFGCVMLHTLAHEWPTPKGPVVGDQKTRVLIALSELDRRKTYMQKLTSIPDQVKNLITQCLSNYAEERPNIQVVTDQLAEIKSQYSSSLNLTVLDAQVQLQKTKDSFRDAHSKMEEVYSYLFPSTPAFTKTPSKLAQSPSSQASKASTSHSKLSVVTQEPHSLAAHAGQPQSLPVTAVPMMTTLPSVATSVAAVTTVAVKDDRLVQSLTADQLMLRDEATVFAQRSQSVPDDTDGSFVKSKPMPKEKASRASDEFVKYDELLDSKEPPVVKEKDEVFNISSDETKLDGQAGKAVQPVVTMPPPVPATTTGTAPVVTSVSDVMKIDGSPEVRKAMPKTEPHPTPTSTIPTTSTVETSSASLPPVTKPSLAAVTDSPQQGTLDTLKRATRIIPQLESKYMSLLDNLPENYESSLARLQQILSDQQICDILCVPEARGCNQKILNCLIERVHCEEDVLDLCSHLEKIMGSQTLVSIVEELRKEIMESLQAKSSTGKQRLSSGSDKSWSAAGDGDHMTYSQMASACLATREHAKELTGQLKDYKMKWDRVDDLTDKAMSTSVVELDGKVYAVLESTSARFLNVRMYNSEANAWTSLPPLQFGAASLATVPSKGQLLAIGGIYHPDSNCSNISKKVFLWDEKYETWLTVYPDMPTSRCYCCSMGYKSMVIVVGGTVQYEGHRNTGAVEILKTHDSNPRDSQWCIVRSMPTLTYQYMVPVLVEETLYIACGFRRGLPFTGYNILSAYIPALLSSTNRDAHPTWNHLPELPYSSFSISHIDDHLVAFGGEQIDVMATRRLDGRHRLCSVPAIHVYKPLTHDWEQVGDVPHIYSLGCAVHLQENKIMFVGSFYDPSCVTDKDLMTTCAVVTITK